MDVYKPGENGKYICDLCGNYTLRHKCGGDHCNVCGWMDSESARNFPDSHDNYCKQAGLTKSLNEIRQMYKDGTFEKFRNEDAPKMIQEIREKTQKEYDEHCFDDTDPYEPNEHGMFICDLCGCYSIPEKDAFEICPVCGWEDDGVGRDNANRAGACPIPLNEARELYKAGKWEDFKENGWAKAYEEGRKKRTDK